MLIFNGIFNFSFNKYMLGIFIRGMLLEIGGSFLVIIIRKIVMERSVVIFIESFLLELLGIQNLSNVINVISMYGMIMLNRQNSGLC